MDHVDRYEDEACCPVMPRLTPAQPDATPLEWWALSVDRWFGLGKPETRMAYRLVHDGPLTTNGAALEGTTDEIAARLGMRSYKVMGPLHSLATAGFLTRESEGRRHRFAIDPDALARANERGDV